MSLATRCSTCGTTFRVVQDQLKVSEGWVRCGKCQTVFNAVEGLFDLERDAPAPRQAAASNAAPVPASPTVAIGRAMDPAIGPPLGPPLGPAIRPAVASPASVLPVPSLPAPPAVPPAASGFVASTPAVAFVPDPPSAPDSEPDSDPPLLLEKPGPKPATAVGARDRLEFSDARFDSDLFEEDPRLDEDEAGAQHATGAGSLPLESEMTPEFLRRAERRQAWRPEPSRGIVGGLLAAALFGLVVQIAVHHRAAIAAAWPWTHGPLDVACAVGGCTVEAPRRIDAVTVESTALARAVGQDGFVLTVALRNRGATALVTPSVDLTLTDGSGRLVARRALAPAQLNAPPTLGPGADLQLQAALDVRGVRVAGYTVEIFYP